MFSFLQRNFDFVLAFALAALLALAVAGCGDTPTAPTPTPDPPAVVVVVEPPPPVVAPVGPAAFCPFAVTDNITADYRDGKLVVSWDIPNLVENNGQYLKRYQVEATPGGILEAQIDRLSGKNNIRAQDEWFLTSKPSTVKVRAHYPQECRGEDGTRANTPWSSDVGVGG